MALTATLTADFSSFVAAAKDAGGALNELKTTANTTGKMLDAMADGYDTGGAVAETKQLTAALDQVASTSLTTVAPALDRVGDATATAGVKGDAFKQSFNQVDKTLSAAGVSLGPLPGMLDELTAAAGMSVTQLGLLGTAGFTVAAAMTGWGIGKKIDEWTGWSDAIARGTAKLMGWGDVAGQEAAAGADTLARASALAGHEVTEMAVAVRILQDAVVAGTEEQKKLAAELKLSEAAAERFATFTAKLVRL